MKTITTIAALLLLVSLGSGCSNNEDSMTGPPAPTGPNALLSGLNTSVGSLTPGFVAFHRAYTVYVPAGTAEITVTARSGSSNPEIRILANGFAPEGVSLQSGVASPAVQLANGDNEIRIVSKSGETTMEYTLTVKLLSF